MFQSSLSTSLWMGGLEQNMDEQTIIDAFAHFGEAVVAIRNMKPPDPTMGQKGHCFIEFYDVTSAQRVLHKLNGRYIPGISGQNRFKLNPASFGRDLELQPEFSLFVGDLSTDVDDYMLYEFFHRRYKSVRGAKAVVEKNRSRGYGFIRFSEESDQQRALIEMQHMTGLGRRPIKVSLASVKKPNEAPPPTGSSPYDSYYAGHYSWGGYNFHYNQSYSAAPVETPADYGVAPAPPPPVPVEDEDAEVLEDPCLEINVGKENREFIDSSEGFFAALESSRWHPLDSLTSDVPD